MTDVFLRVIEMSMTASIVIGVIMLLRLILRKAPKVFSYVLWAAALFRLLCPVSFELPSAPIPNVDISYINEIEERSAENLFITDMENVPIPEYSQPQTEESEQMTAVPDTVVEAPAKKEISIISIASYIWALAVMVMAIRGVVSWVKLSRSLRFAQKMGENVYVSTAISDPFLMGIIRPKIYLPTGLSSVESDLIIRHEKAHMRRGDHIAKLVMYAALCIHCFNPLVWVMFRLFERDMEMSCDEKVTSNMTKEEKADYSQTLLKTSSKPTAAFTAFFGENSTKKRIKNVLSFKKPAVWVVIVLTAAAVVVSLVLCVSRKSDSNQNQIDDVYKPFEIDYSEDFEYTFTTIYSPRIAVANDGRMAVSSQKSKDTAGVQFVEYSMDGSSKNIGEFEGYIDSLAYMGDDLFFAIVKWNTELKSEGVLIYKINTETGNNELFAEIDGIPITYVYAAKGNSNELYLLGEDSSKSDNDAPMLGITSAKSIIRYHDGNYEKLPVEFPTAVCAKKTGGAIIAAYDADGYYITTYENGQLSDKKYINSNGTIGSIADVDGKHIAFTVATKSNRIMLCAANTDNMYNAELIPDSTAGEELFSTGGLCFFNAGRHNANETEQTITIKRIEFSKYYKERPPMNLLITDYSDSTPFGCGYTINVNGLSSEKAALKILSLDKDYDMCYISTRDRIAYSIKSQGSFYPLNDVPGVSEYLDKCFPSIKDAFTDKNGNIWALPIWSNSYFIAQNTGETDFSEMTTDQFIDYIDGLSESDTSKSLFNAYTYTDEILKEYVMTHDSFDTQEFRATAEKLKKSSRVNFAAPEYKFMVSGDYYNPLFLESTLMILGIENSYSFMQSGAHYYSVTGVPCVSNKNVLLPNVIFLCVNPNSEHLQNALDYISKIADYQMTNPNQFVLTQENGVYSDNNTVRQMSELYNSAEVYFTYPSEIYWDDFCNYLSDRISLEQFITESDRKLKAYLNE